MDLKNTILETLQEIEDSAINEESLSLSNAEKCDKEFLKHIKERILVLFEGLQSPNTDNIEIKLDITINFLEYLLVKIDEKLSQK